MSQMSQKRVKKKRSVISCILIEVADRLSLWRIND